MVGDSGGFEKWVAEKQESDVTPPNAQTSHASTQPMEKPHQLQDTALDSNVR